VQETIKMTSGSFKPLPPDRQASVGELSSGSIPETQVFPASFIQQQFWLTQMLYPQSSASNIPFGCRIKGHLDESALRKSLEEIIKRNAIFRTSFFIQGEKLFQSVYPEVFFDLAIEDLSDRVIPTELLDNLMNEETSRPFDLTRAPLLRAKLLRRASDDRILLLTMHHIVGDLETRRLFVNQLASFYSSFLSGNAPCPSDSDLSYANYSLWQQEWLKSDAADRMLSYWKQKLADSPPPIHFPIEGQRPLPPHLNGSEWPVDLSAASYAHLKQFSREEQVNLFTTLLAAYGVTLYKYGGRQEIVVGAPLTNRKREEDRETLGAFANILPLRLSFAGNPSFREVVRRVRLLLLEAHRNQDIPFEVILQETRLNRGDAVNPLFRFGFTFEPSAQLHLEGLSVEQIAVRRGSPPLDIFILMIGRRTEA
jgi:hypothetical protein